MTKEKWQLHINISTSSNQRQQHKTEEKKWSEEDKTKGRWRGKRIVDKTT